MFRDRLTALVPDLSVSQVDALEAHYRLLGRWNRVLNLTRIEGEDEAAERNYGESLWLAGRLPVGPLRVVDVGSGAGFPGIPLAIARPECSVMLVESHQRKAVFLKEAARDLANVSVMPRRIEDVTERFDWAVSRAVRWEEVSGSVVRVAASVALLGGGEGPANVQFSWDVREQLPWGQQRFLYRGTRVEHP